MKTSKEVGSVKTLAPKRSKSKSENVIQCFGPCLTFEYVFGIFRFRLYDGNFLSTTRIAKLFSVLMTAAVAIVFGITYDFHKALSGTRDLVEVMKDFPTIVILIQYLTSAVMTSCFLCATNIRIMTSLADLDSTLRINKNKHYYRKSRNHAIIALTVIVLVHLLSSTWDLILETPDDNGIIIKIFSYVLNFVQDLEILVFFLMISLLKKRLQVINQYLSKLVHHDTNQDKKSVSTITRSYGKDNVEKKFDLVGNVPVRNLRELSKAYDIIGETCRLVNGVYNFQIFMTLISAFVYIVITLWTSLYYFRTQVYTGDLIAIILWCCSEMLTVASMAFVCEMLVSTRNDTKVLVNELVMDYGLPNGVRALAKAFMELIDAWPLRVFVYDMFTVDLTLMLKFISVSTTYLIVIIQISHFQ